MMIQARDIVPLGEPPPPLPRGSVREQPQKCRAWHGHHSPPAGNLLGVFRPRRPFPARPAGGEGRPEIDVESSGLGFTLANKALLETGPRTPRH